MAVTDIVRPASTPENEGSSWETVPSGSTLHARTSDQSNSTYAKNDSIGLGLGVGGGTEPLGGNNDLLRLAMASHTPAANHQRHRIRALTACTAVNLSGSGNAGLAFRAILGSGTSGPLVSANILSRSLSTPLATPWSFGEGDLDITGTGAKTFGTRARANPTNLSSINQKEVRLTEVWVEIDCREKPTFAADVKDGAGASQAAGTIADTSRPRLTFGTIDTDGLAARTWSVAIVEQGSGIIKFSASGSGTPPETILSSGLPPGSYTAKYNLSSTIRANDEFAATEVTIDFDLTFVSTPVIVDQPNQVSDLKLHYTALPRRRGERGL